MNFCVLLGLTLAAFGCSVKAAGHGSSSSHLASLLDDFWQWRLREWPEYGTKFGFPENNARIENYTEAAFTRQKNEAQMLLDSSMAISESNLVQQDVISLKVLRELLQTFIDGYQYRAYSIYNYLSPLDNVMYRLNRMVSMLPKDTELDFNNILARYAQVPQQLVDMEVLLRMAVEKGTTAHNTSVVATIEDLDNADSATFLDPFSEENMPSSIPQATRASLRNRAEQLVPMIMNGITAYRNYLQQSYIPRPFAGVGTLADGYNYYRACLKWHISTDMTPEDVHQLGLREVERISLKMAEIMRQNGYSGTVKEYISHLKEDPNNFYQTSDEMLAGFREIISRAHDQLHTILDNVPDAPVEVRQSPQTVSRYSDPKPDGTPGIFWAYVDDPQEKPKFNMPALALHEAEPGHHTQFTYSAAYDLPLFRKYVEYLRYPAVPFNWLFQTAYSEGWALYAESLGEEMGLYRDSLELFGRYASEIHRASRLVVDTGIHVKGWSIEEAEQYMRDNTALGDISIYNEVIRYVSWPGQACSYKIGEIKITELRKYSEEQLGDRFSLKAFHHEIMLFGAVPLSLLEDHIHNWVSDQLYTTDAAAGLSCCAYCWSVTAGLVLMVAVWGGQRNY